jgi:uncharacterized protein
MNDAFADTYYFLAILGKKDRAHQRAVEMTAGRKGRLITTIWVLTELANALSRVGDREAFADTLRELRSDPGADIVPADQNLFESGVGLFIARPDKEWSLTDCISFVVMQQMGLTDALTADHHFEQAGFVALLK